MTGSFQRATGNAFCHQRCATMKNRCTAPENSSTAPAPTTKSVKTLGGRQVDGAGTVLYPIKN
ncbi:MAG TPA: hypothetical protein VMC42_09905 [Methanoregulaceae archaeon]|nr:hypothetical protein [Methanoregulaceae archaeon]